MRLRLIKSGIPIGKQLRMRGAASDVDIVRIPPLRSIAGGLVDELSVCIQLYYAKILVCFDDQSLFDALTSALDQLLSARRIFLSNSLNADELIALQRKSISLIVGMDKLAGIDLFVRHPDLGYIYTCPRNCSLISLVFDFTINSTVSSVYKAVFWKTSVREWSFAGSYHRQAFGSSDFCEEGCLTTSIFLLFPVESLCCYYLYTWRVCGIVL
jgi:hypothetical protein